MKFESKRIKVEVDSHVYHVHIEIYIFLCCYILCVDEG